MVPDFAHVGFTAEIPLPNQGFTARFLGWFKDWASITSNTIERGLR